MQYRLILFIFVSLFLTFCSNSSYEKVFTLSKSGNITELENLLAENNFNLDTVDKQGYSPLAYSVKYQKLEMLKFLISKGASVNYYKYLYTSPLFIALSAVQTDILVDTNGYDSSTKEEIIKILIHNGFVIDKNTLAGKNLVTKMRDIKKYDLRQLAFTNVIEDTSKFKKRKLDSIKYAKEYKQRVIDYNNKKNIPLVTEPNIIKENNSVSFKLHNVKTASSLLSELDYIKAIKQRKLFKIEFCNKLDYKLIPSPIHPFARAVQRAYDEHRPLIISPDIVWLLIIQGFAKHIELNPNKYRKKLVDFEGVKRIDIVRNDFVRGETDSLWPKVIKQFGQHIDKYLIDTTLHSKIAHFFSTTTNKELTAFEIAFLEINKHYFEYHFWACGIPKITLEGNTEDWIWIRNNIEQFKNYDLNWWIKKLVPILDQFIQTSKGNIDLKFWSKIYRYDQNCNSNITGWFAKFFPYIRKGVTKFKKNPLVLKEPVYHDTYYWGGIENENFVSGLSYVDFIFHMNRDSSRMSFVSGFVGIKQNHKTKALKPEINWLILNK
ncbi:MAG: DUF4419 domain-containing protein [Bacteroidota bacterium]